MTTYTYTIKKRKIGQSLSGFSYAIIKKDGIIIYETVCYATPDMAYCDAREFILSQVEQYTIRKKIIVD